MRGSTVTNTISIAVSSCLLGENVRYDGGNRKNGHVIDLQEQGFELIAVCPEVDIGLPTPREPIDLVFAPTQRPSARLRCDYRVDYSTRLRQAAYRFFGNHPNVCGFVFKSRSPSCGLHDTQAYDTARSPIGQGAGIFAEEVQLLKAGIPVIDDVLFNDIHHRQKFLKAVQSWSLSLP
ncbi:MAG: DUF523 domain-containing protein [Bdellovibrionaceae bacterium]|nr:DUF523 domain-containing protein [Bdellovibrionales bacterium]MCB9085503.1 DUF523 domain-containing protein [Pseudobdellovibrionaceae bacterium]